jgi:hypothetical protein
MVKRADLKTDRFYKNAKKEGYRSRSAFKLLQIVNKFEVIGKGYKKLQNPIHTNTTKQIPKRKIVGV